MAFDVRLFGHAGLVRMPVIGQRQFSSDSVYQLKQPYLWAQKLTTAGTSTAVASTAAPTPADKTIDPTEVLRIEIPAGQSIRYEVNPPNRTTSASTNSPIMSGNNQIAFGPGWTLSIVEA